MSTRPNNCTQCGADEDTRGGLCFGCAARLYTSSGVRDPKSEAFLAAVARAQIAKRPSLWRRLTSIFGGRPPP